MADKYGAGNIDLTNRPRVRNADGSISTVRSASFNMDGKEVLLPTVSEDGRIMSDDEAVAQYRKTGRYLGKFNTVKEADAYAERLHNDQAKTLESPMAKKHKPPHKPDAIDRMMAEQDTPAWQATHPDAMAASRMLDAVAKVPTTYRDELVNPIAASVAPVPPPPPAPPAPPLVPQPPPIMAAPPPGMVPPAPGPLASLTPEEIERLKRARGMQ